MPYRNHRNHRNNRNNPNHPNKKGFTFVELLIVMAIMAGLLALSAPMVTALRSQVVLNQTIRHAKTDLITTLGYSLAGKSIAALSTPGQAENPDLIPSLYALAFQTDPEAGDPTPYRYLEYTTSMDSSNTQSSKTIYEIDKDLPSTNVFLKTIRLKKNAEDDGHTVSSLHVFFIPPFGKIAFAGDLVETTSFDPVATLAAGQADTVAELTFQYKDDPDQSITLSLGTDKTIQIL
jgi:prepilin-type N-terminal cleavage/methylation domain-containing protein